MNFFDLKSSVQIPDLPAETFERKLICTFDRYNIKYEKTNNGKVEFSISMFQLTGFNSRRLIFRGVSSGEIEFFNLGKDLSVQFNLSFVPTRVLLLFMALSMMLMSKLENDFSPLIMVGLVIILYFTVRDGMRHKFKKWFSRFTK